MRCHHRFFPPATIFGVTANEVEREEEEAAAWGLFLLPFHIDVVVDVDVNVDFVVCLARRIHLCRSRVESSRVVSFRVRGLTTPGTSAIKYAARF